MYIKKHIFDFPKELKKIFVSYITFLLSEEVQISKHLELTKTKIIVKISVGTDLALYSKIGLDEEGINIYPPFESTTVKAILSLQG